MVLAGPSPPLEPLRDAPLLRPGILSVFPSKTSLTATLFTMRDVQEETRDWLSNLSKKKEALSRRKSIPIKIMMMMMTIHTGIFSVPRMNN